MLSTNGALKIITLNAPVPWSHLLVMDVAFQNCQENNGNLLELDINPQSVLRRRNTEGTEMKRVPASEWVACSRN